MRQLQLITSIRHPVANPGSTSGRWLLVTALILPLLLTACRGGDTPSDAITAIAAVPTLVVAHEPDVTIGVTKGKVPYLLNVVTGATRLSDGTIVVADATSAELRYFDASGRYVRTTGRRGRGPGEFNWIRRIFSVAGDTIGVDDLDRVTILAPDGGLVRTTSLPGGPLDIAGRLASGLFVARPMTPREPVEFAGGFWETNTLYLLDATGQRVDSLGGLPWREVRASPDQQRGDWIGDLRLGRSASLAVSSERIYYGAQDEARIIVFDGSLRQVDSIRTITEPAPVTEEAKRTFQTMVDEGAQWPGGSVMTGLLSDEHYAPAIAAHGDLIAGRDGALWVQDPLRPAHYPLVWTAYEDGRPVTRAEIPPRFFPFEFGRDWVLGVSFDDFNVERVELWRLVPGELPGRVLPPRDAEPPVLHRYGVWHVR